MNAKKKLISSYYVRREEKLAKRYRLTLFSAFPAAEF